MQVLADRITVEWVDTRGRHWGPVNALAADIRDQALRRDERNETWRIDVCEMAGPGRVRMAVGDASRGIRIGLWLELAGGARRTNRNL